MALPPQAVVHLPIFHLLAGHQRFLRLRLRRPPEFQERALRAKVARLRVFGLLDFFFARSVETGIFFPFFVFVDFRNLPWLDFLILIPLRRLRLATITSSCASSCSSAFSRPPSRLDATSWSRCCDGPSWPQQIFERHGRNSASHPSLGRGCPTRAEGPAFALGGRRVDQRPTRDDLARLVDDLHFHRALLGAGRPWARGGLRFLAPGTGYE